MVSESEEPAVGLGKHGAGVPDSPSLTPNPACVSGASRRGARAAGEVMAPSVREGKATCLKEKWIKVF